MVGKLKEKENKRSLRILSVFLSIGLRVWLVFMSFSSSETESKLLVLKYNLGQKITIYFFIY